MYLSYLVDSITKMSPLLPQHHRAQLWSVLFHNFKTIPRIIFGRLYKYHTTSDNYTVVLWFLIPCQQKHKKAGV
jgi:hypothetical protein